MTSALCAWQSPKYDDPMSKYLIGELIVAGQNPAKLCEGAQGVFVRCTDEQIRAPETLPMYQQVALVPLEDLAALTAELACGAKMLARQSDLAREAETREAKLRNGLCSLLVMLRHQNSDWTGPWEDLDAFDNLLIRPVTGSVPPEYIKQAP